MTQESIFSLIFAPEVIDHLRVIDKKYHNLIRETISQQLTYNPLDSTRNRKLLKPPAPFAATWELRFGSKNCFRVFYEVNETKKIVLVLAIGIKNRDKLIIGGDEIGL
jgi:mRNA-degrading endonuclease RelE of RelBE toxin-antitoxin system